MLKVRGLVPLAGALLIIAASIALFGFSGTLNPIDALLGRGRLVTVPDFTGRAVPGARAEAEDLGLTTSTTNSFSLTAPRGSIINQAPEPGEKVRSGDELELVVSTGANRVEMPDAVGQPLTEVAGPLQDADVPLEIVEVPNEFFPDGTVVAQQPAAGVQVTGEDSVRLEVSTGPQERPVPEVAGLALEGAAFQLGQAGLLLGAVTQIDSPDVVAGAVISTDPPAATSVARDTAIALVVSNGAAPIPVPDVTNHLEGPATKELEAAGFVVDVAGRLLAVGDAGKGNVYEQSPAAGTPLRPGQVVTIVVGREAPPPRTTTTTTTTTTTPTTTTTTRRSGG
ncbi:MAG: PASTA domain-containing protein [Microthrixaceae bacterium]